MRNKRNLLILAEGKEAKRVEEIVRALQPTLRNCFKYNQTHVVDNFQKALALLNTNQHKIPNITDLICGYDIPTTPQQKGERIPTSHLIRKLDEDAVVGLHVPELKPQQFYHKGKMLYLRKREKDFQNSSSYLINVINPLARLLGFPSIYF